MRERARKKAMEEDVLDVQEEEESESEEVGNEHLRPIIPLT